MRFIPALFLILTFQSAFAVDDYPIADYKCWLFTGVVASCLQIVPQAFEIAYAQALVDEAQTAPHNATTPYIRLFSSTSAISNALGLLSAVPLIYNAGKGVVSPSNENCRRRTMEFAFAMKTLSSMGMQVTASYLTFNLYGTLNGSGRPDALLGVAVSGGISLALAMLPFMSAVALVVKSACMTRNGYHELEQSV